MIRISLACLMLVSAVGCTQVRRTDPPHTATELYLLSTASQNAVQGLSGQALRGRLVYVDRTFIREQYLDFIVAAARARLLAGGARMVEHRADAEIIVEMRTPGVGIDRTEFLLGVPGIPVGSMASAAGIPGGEVTTPELALIKNVKQWGTAGIAFVAYWRETGQIVAASGPHIGRSYREDWSIFGLATTVSDIPPTRPPEAHEPGELEASEDAQTEADGDVEVEVDPPPPPDELEAPGVELETE